ncbi:hypothetical protein KIF53_15655 [Chromobacterium subtsugae]|uniref:Excisionase n=1 Tax=Chromobacterium subtsugae TaxID=251747 RepID=A0ABS7FG60_9NEIS|nr:MULTISPECIES: excisionase [Chromobacterium]MBW7567842.1 hypothetical protein [Chromobacterium subtsugae]MBW8289069.1 hypothetical protein [Chromobacterium subtsugae]
MKWVTLTKYCEDSGDTKDAVYNRRRRGTWLDGRECKLVSGKLWVNTEAVKKWIENEGMKSHKAA